MAFGRGRTHDACLCGADRCTVLQVLPLFQTAAMAVGDLEVTAERENVISFSHTILSTQASLLIRKAKSTQNFFQVSVLFSQCLLFYFLIWLAGLKAPPNSLTNCI